MSFFQDQLKSYLIRDKAFLQSLYRGDNYLKNKRVIQSANETELNTLIKFIYCVCNGFITIDTTDYEVIKKRKKLPLISKHFDTDSEVNQLLSEDLQFKQILLLKLSSVYPYLLSTLFVLPNKPKHGI